MTNPNHIDSNICTFPSDVPNFTKHNEFVDAYIEEHKSAICLKMNNKTDDGLNCGINGEPGTENFRMIACKWTYDYLYKVSRTML